MLSYAPGTCHAVPMGKGNRNRVSRGDKAVWVPLLVECPECGTHYPSPAQQRVLTSPDGTIRVAYRHTGRRAQCPTCGAPMPTHFETRTRYEVVQTAAGALAVLPASQLRSVRDQLIRVQEGDMTPEEARLQSSDARVRSFWDLLPKTRGEYYAVIAILVSIITVLVSIRPDDSAPTISPGQLEEILRRVVGDTEVTPTPTD